MPPVDLRFHGPTEIGDFFPTHPREDVSNASVMAIRAASTAAAMTVRVHCTGTPQGVMGKVMRGTMQKRITQNWQRSLEKLDVLARQS